MLVAKNYLKTVCSEDISRVDGVQRDELLTRMILRSYARNISTLAKKSSMIADVAALGLTPEALMVQLNTFGFIFEQMCIRDLNKLGSKEIEDGAGHLVELKRLIREHNKKAAGKREKSDACIDSSEREQAGPKVKETQMPIREPDLMIVLTGGKMAYTRPDGVKIIPLGCLKD